MLRHRELFACQKYSLFRIIGFFPMELYINCKNKETKQPPTEMTFKSQAHMP